MCMIEMGVTGLPVQSIPTKWMWWWASGITSNVKIWLLNISAITIRHLQVEQYLHWGWFDWFRLFAVHVITFLPIFNFSPLSLCNLIKVKLLNIYGLLFASQLDLPLANHHVVFGHALTKMWWPMSHQGNQFHCSTLRYIQQSSELHHRISEGSVPCGQSYCCHTPAPRLSLAQCCCLASIWTAKKTVSS